MRPAKLFAVLAALILVVPGAAQVSERVNLEAMERIKTEAGRQPQAMEIATALTNTYGPRLTNSPNIRAAGEYLRKKLTEWKLSDVRLEPWNFGNGWTNDKFSLKFSSDPALVPLAHPKAWTPGTPGPLSADVVEAVIRSEADFARLRGTLRGKVVMILPAPTAPVSTSTPPVNRWTDEALKNLALPPAAAPGSPAPAAVPAAPAAPSAAPAAPDAETGFFAWVENALSAAPAQATGPVQPAARPANAPALTRDRVTAFYFEEGVAAMIEPGPVRGGALFAITATGEPNPWKKDSKTSKVPPQIVLAADQYAKVFESVQKSGPVRLDLDIQNTYLTADPNAFNVVADIKGTDKADEFVVLGAHMDSWNVGKGATDNAAGTAVMMEAMRILRASGLPMRRTVRLGLWTGEEQGLLGSRAFVDKYFINRPIAQTRPGHEKLSVYFNLDNGTGAIRGIYMQGNPEVAPIFEAWMAPFRSIGMTTLTPRNDGSTDHLSFDNAGLPGFQFIQDSIQYDTLTHHSTMDTLERILPEDLLKNAVIVASFAYSAANRDTPLPRKPLPRSIQPAGSPVP